jgi:phospho-N-acetylmuramoyl-pentapeptide-transferase
VKTILLSAAVSMFVALFGTPLAIKAFTRRGYGQEIRSDGPAGHLSKRGTPTMGGTVIIIASLGGYLIGHLVTGSPVSASGLLVMFLMAGLGLVGFADDFIKLYMQRSLGLRSGAKLAGQAIVGGIFAMLAIRNPDGYDLTPASTHLSFIADFGISIGPVLFVVWVILMVAGTSNGVNLTDGLDGLATGAAILALAAYMIIGIWQLRNDCTVFLASNCFQVRDPLDLAVVAATVMGACSGFLWWNAPPAKIFMGDTGSLALGGVLAGLAITTRTELLLLLLGGLFVIITLSVVIQVGSFKLTGKRVFRMAPLQHHFELAGWAETTIVVRFWIIAGMCVALGLGIFYVGLPGSRPATRRRRTACPLGERGELVVHGRAGEPVGQGGHRVGADAEHDLEGVLGGEAAGEELPERLVPDVARGVEHPERERPHGFQPLVRKRPGVPQLGDQVRAGAHGGEPGRVHGHADMAAVPGGDGHHHHLARQRVQRGTLEDLVQSQEPVEQVRRGRHPGHRDRKVAEVLLGGRHGPARSGRGGFDGVLSKHGVLSGHS